MLKSFKQIYKSSHELLQGHIIRREITTSEMNNFYWLFILSIHPPFLPVFLLNTFFHRPQSLTISSLNHSTPNHTLSYAYPLGRFKNHLISRPVVSLLESYLFFPASLFITHIPVYWPIFSSDVCPRSRSCFLEFDLPPLWSDYFSRSGAVMASS